MIEIQISERLKNISSDVFLGCLTAEVKVKDSHEELWNLLETNCQKIAEEMKVEDIAKLANIKDGRSVYRGLGNDPTRYRLSSEALLRRILKEKGLYKINNVVEINNFISISSNYPVCAYDLDKLQGPIVFTVGEPGESYEGIGRGIINIENLPVFSDQKGKFGSTTSDSERAMVNEKTTSLLLCIVSFSGDKNMATYLEQAQELLERYAQGRNIEIQVIQ